MRLTFARVNFSKILRIKFTQIKDFGDTIVKANAGSYIGAKIYICVPLSKYKNCSYKSENWTNRFEILTQHLHSDISEPPKRCRISQISFWNKIVSMVRIHTLRIFMCVFFTSCLRGEKLAQHIFWYGIVVSYLRYSWTL